MLFIGLVSSFFVFNFGGKSMKTLLSNMVLGGLGLPDILGGFTVGLITSTTL